MKKILFSTLLILPFAFLHAQLTGTLFGTSYSFDKPTMHSSGGGNNNQNSRWNSGSSDYTPAPTSSENITKEYGQKAREEYNRGIKAWNKRDWNVAIRSFKVAIAYDKNNSYYQSALNKAKGYKEWDEGVAEANKENWDKAIELYKNALQYFPNDATLKNNIIGCSYNKTLGLAKKYFDKGDWINAAVYYNIMMKNFGNESQFVQTRFSDSYTKISNMRESEQALSKFNLRVEDVKKDLPFVNNGW